MKVLFVWDDFVFERQVVKKGKKKEDGHERVAIKAMQIVVREEKSPKLTPKQGGNLKH